MTDFTVCGVGSTASTPTAAGASAFASGVSSPSPSVDVADGDAATATSTTTLATVRRRVRYLGWRYLDPDDVARAERSSGAVNRCILALAGAEAAGELTAQPATLELGRQSLRLLSPAVDTDDDAEEAGGRPPPPLLMPSQPLLAIRLWGVGRRRRNGGGDGNGDGGGAAAGRHFAYVARDDVNKYVCHVIDCDGEGEGDTRGDGDDTAVRIANAVCQRCRRLISQRRRRQQQQRCRSPPDDLRLALDGDTATAAASPFPSPQEEPSKCIPCLYLGCVPVSGPGGLDRLNAAIETAVAEAADGRRRARPVTARVSPSSLRFEPATSSAAAAAEDDVDASTATAAAAVVELRVRYLSFMGVGRGSVRHAGFIAQTALGAFECHVCRCEPSCGPLCRTVEAACNLRYQKCLDSLAASPTTAAAAGAAAVAGGMGGGGPAATGGGGVKTDIVQAVSSLFNGLRRLSIK